MPAEKSKNSFPSTSVTTMPRPCLATSGYERVYDGEMYLLSPSSTRIAFGPGRAVLILGPIRVWVGMASSKKVVGRSSLVAGFQADFNPEVRNRTRRICELVAAE